ncbi:MAG: PleD family two-component system response regulator [Hyphomicrobiales bacterium]|nr:PleD family two-component system response regulator [Hyphomicrobiales bacterium]MBV8768938.1 PleD family two-component system response regulator [Hyphomicrobiales bacterium]MBV9591768.1 PleD family two-component system response regulator [Hyphomicrobiales bacterium]MBV9751965.1 PleD family two-component system response regulator [Hyphomicrobiales bacterium]MBV9975961.1 PleD family two-component system response regulator [Hyphomicrobiales bacterium]
MTARVLVVDDTPANLKVLETQLSAEYFNVKTAMSGAQGLALLQADECDIVLLDVMMPQMDGFEVCRRIKCDPLTAHIPVVMVTALDQPADRVAGLEAGADDFLTKPIDEVALVSRVRSLVRLKSVRDELRARALRSKDMGMGDPLALAAAESGLNGRILLVEDRASVSERMFKSLSAFHRVEVEDAAENAVFRAAEQNYDLTIVSLTLAGHDGLRICAQLRSLERTRNMSLLMVAEAGDKARLLRGLDIGADDFLVRPVDRNELLARVRTQVRNQRYAASLRNSVQQSMELALIDPLTGLHNRRFLDANMDGLLKDALRRSRPLSLIMMDVDLFKAINDTYGHDCGDEVLRELAHRARDCLRTRDLLVRYGGEELIAILPETGHLGAQGVAERIRQAVHGTPFLIAHGACNVTVTISLGVAVMRNVPESRQDLFKRADEALYRAKHEGRNRVVLDAA